MPGNNFKPNRKGFTLMEIVVVLAIFSVLAVVIVDVFILALRSQRQTSLRQNTLANLRYVMETISRQVRISEIDYEYYPDGIIDPIAGELALDELALKDPINPDRQFVYFLDGQEIKLEIIEDGATEEAWLTTINEVRVVNLDFYINPVTDPFSVIADRCNEALSSNGCESGITCTVNDGTTTDKTGFCLCSGDGDCASQNCNLSEGICLPKDEQPRVTIVLDFESEATRPEDIKRIYLQTTISSRVYKR